jgi:GDPmannose 4,6-dehydratase
MSIAIIFGGTGQDAFYLKEIFNLKYIKTILISRVQGDYIGDVGNFQFVENLIKKYKPNYVIHFAATSSINHEYIINNHNSILTGTINILESVKLHSINTKIFLSGSALQFKNEGLPINEQSLFDYSNHYSILRNQCVDFAKYYRNNYGLKVYIGYFFNHDSPYRTENHLNKKIATAVLRIKNGSEEKIEIGNIKIKKEFNYAGDIMNAVWIFINQNSIFDLVIGSGKVYSIEEYIAYCFNSIGKNYINYIEEDKNYIPNYYVLQSDPKLLYTLGWKPVVDFYQLANFMLLKNK